MGVEGRGLGKREKVDGKSERCPPKKKAAKEELTSCTAPSGL